MALSIYARPIRISLRMTCRSDPVHLAHLVALFASERWGLVSLHLRCNCLLLCVPHALRTGTGTVTCALNVLRIRSYHQAIEQRHACVTRDTQGLMPICAQPASLENTNQSPEMSHALCATRTRTHRRAATSWQTVRATRGTPGLMVSYAPPALPANIKQSPEVPHALCATRTRTRRRALTA